MGRMLETMKLGEARRTPLAINQPADAAPVQDCVVDWEIGEEVPYVEVGGPNKKIELSPGLLQHPAQAAPQPPHLPIEPVSAAPKPKAIQLTEAKPMTAMLAPWPVPAPTPLAVSAEVVTFHQPEHMTSKEYAGLFAAMRRGLKADTANVLLLLGMKPRVGTSTVLLNLAVTAATQDLRVIVVDANPHHASLARRLGHGPAKGLGDVLDGTFALDQAVLKTCIGSLHLLPAGAPSQDPITTEAMSWLIAWLRERYDLILIDGPTIVDAVVQIPHADNIYLVLPRGESPSKSAAQSVSRMGGRLCGLIHTHFDV